MMTLVTAESQTVQRNIAIVIEEEKFVDQNAIVQTVITQQTILIYRKTQTLSQKRN